MSQYKAFDLRHERTAEQEFQARIRKSTAIAAFMKRLLKRPLQRAAFVILSIIILSAIFAPVISPYDPLTPEFADARQPPSAAHLFGTDDIGRDILSRILFGARVSLMAAILPLAIQIVFGVPLGLAAGFLKGWVDDLIMRVLDALLAFPRIILIIAIAGVLGPNLINALVAIGIVSVAPLARLTRGLSLSTSENEYVTVARALGAPNLRIMFQHVLPNMLAPIIVSVSLNIGTIILAEATQSFLGLGLQPPEPSLGSMVAVGNRYIQQCPWISLVPGTAIFLTVMSVNLLGDGFRDAMDPYLKSRQ